MNLEEFSEHTIKELMIRKLTYYPDFRGQFIKLFLNNEFIEEDAAISYFNTLRGFHYTLKGRRIFTPIYGKFYIVALDIREDSDTKNMWYPFNIEDGNRMSFIIPPYVAFAYLVRSQVGIVHYKWETQYNEDLERTIRFNDEQYGVYWPGDKSSFIVSERDYHCDESYIR